ncbi:MAG: polysaccharide biosynthesis tyrosine autokinase [Moorea sp. SIO3I7]|uniref:GumC family protein n=1 Tax=unclassified Moorena TaxID=2683338 RepID=UPI0013BF55FD|nr:MULTISPECIES: polysaccharide biosynthesis tyrosine autokinase [unclassified Moorena]NEN97160.1 polysaccharide biosynthesis tyrosine autokinase [Moorena sp. SIO3I7]NEO05851.1 polysaccharide biosynthesis tyrosine autokinase [Moorena sp. SIO3I8]NEP22647.1 polysaccharide biosynthesis tyrosine autokinase [Moorena sp. SIO3I6]
MKELDLNGAAETDAGYGQLLAVLWRRRLWIISVLLTSLPIAFYLTLKKEPTYISSLQLLVEPNYIDKTRGIESQFTESTVDIDYATQLQLMRSSELIQRAVDLLRDDYPDITVGDIRGSLRLAQVLQGKTETKVFQAVYTSNDRIKTQKVLQAIQKVYQDYNLEQQEMRLNKGLAFINQQLPTARNNLEQAEQRLEQFRKSKNLIDPSQQALAVSQTLNGIEQERRAIRAQYMETQTRYQAVQQKLARSPQNALTSSRLSQSGRYQNLLNEIQRIELALVEQSRIYTEAHPSIQKLIEQRQSVFALLQEETRRVLGQVPTQLVTTGSNLLTEGQLGGVDINLVNELITSQINLVSLQTRDQALAKTEEEIRIQLREFPALIAQYNRLQPQVAIQQNTLQQLLQARQELSIELARGGFNWQVVEAPLPGSKTGPNMTQDLLLGAVVGLFLGGVAAFVREAMDDGIHTSDDLKNQVALPLLGMIPELPEGKISKPVLNLSLSQSEKALPMMELLGWRPFQEALDMIYVNIQLLNSGSEWKSLMVTSALSGEGKSTLALGLALSAARLHRRVLLIDVDMRRPRLHQQLGLSNQEGLSTLLEDDTATPSPVSISPLGSTIDVLTAGPTPIDPVKLLGSKRMKNLMAEFQQTYDLVLLDTPPVLGMVDALQAASLCQGVLMVGRLERVTQSQLTQATAILRNLNLIGIIANGVKSSNQNYAYYGSRNSHGAIEPKQPVSDLPVSPQLERQLSNHVKSR